MALPMNLKKMLLPACGVGSKTKKPFLEIATGDQQFERSDIKLGISDGIYLEVKSGLDKEDEIKVWNEVSPDEFGGYLLTKYSKDYL